jgi:hypothetical protein
MVSNCLAQMMLAGQVFLSVRRGLMKSIYRLVASLLVVVILVGLVSPVALAQGDRVAEATRLLQEQGYQVLSMEKSTIGGHPAGVVLMPMISQTDQRAIGVQAMYGLVALYIAYERTVAVNLTILAYDQRYAFIITATSNDVGAWLNEQISNEDFAQRTDSFWYDFETEQEVPGPGQQVGKGFGNKNFTGDGGGTEPQVSCVPEAGKGALYVVNYVDNEVVVDVSDQSGILQTAIIPGVDTAPSGGYFCFQLAPGHYVVGANSPSASAYAEVDITGGQVLIFPIR